MKWSVGTKIGAGFALALTILLLVGIVAYQGSKKLTATARTVEHTHLVLQNLEGILSEAKDAETGQRGFIITGEERYLEPYKTAEEEMRKKLKAVRELTEDNPEQQRRLDPLEALIFGEEGRLEMLQQTIDLRKEQGFDAALKKMMTDKGKKVMDSIRQLVGEMVNTENALLKTRSGEADAAAKATEGTILLGTLGAFAVLGMAGFWITRNISGPLRELTGAAEQISTGDLNVKSMATDRRDEVGVLAGTFDRMGQSLRVMAAAAEQIASGDLRSDVTPLSPKDVLGHAFARMTANLRQQMQSLMEGANVLGSAASEIVASSTQLAGGATESATAVSETSTTVEEVRQTAQLASQKAKGVSDNAQRVAQISLHGKKSAEEAAKGMNRIRQQMDSIAQSMVRLSEQGQAIGQIIASVEDLAAQSNLLAVNAAIEAAKAGEHGKGFNVVAQEVKSLAEQSRQATNQVRTILYDIQKATSAAAMATEQGSRVVDSGGKQTEAAGESIQSLTGSISEAAQAATQIAASSQQQLVGMDQVATAMENIKQTSAQNVASAKQLEISARNLNDLGRRIKQMVERYKV